MEEGSAAAGTPPGTTAAREPTVGCDVACSECMAKCVAEVGAAGGSAVEGFMDAVVLMHWRDAVRSGLWTRLNLQAQNIRLHEQ
jgi:hypothetical protein